LACLENNGRNAQANRGRTSDRKESEPHGAFLHRHDAVVSEFHRSSQSSTGFIDAKRRITQQPTLRSVELVTDASFFGAKKASLKRWVGLGGTE
jgi:hypothetical protein